MAPFVALYHPGLGVDVENDFTPNYVAIKGKSKDINTLKKDVNHNH